MARQIFISYTREDNDVVAEMHDDLPLIGNDVFFDQELTGGQRWWSTLLTKIQDCDIFMPVVSESWFESVPCQLETGYAQQLGKSFLPVILGDVPGKLLPPSIAETQWARYKPQQKESVLQLARAISQLQPSPPLSYPLPAPPEVPISYLTELRERVQVRHEISRQDQDLLLVEIRRRLASGKDDRELAIVLGSFRRRDDLNVHVAQEIDVLIQSLNSDQRQSLVQPSQEVGGEADDSGRVAVAPPRTRPTHTDPPPPDPRPDARPHQPQSPRWERLMPRSKVTTSYILSAIAVLFLPIVFGPGAFWLANSAKKEGDPRGQRAIYVAIGATILGFLLFVAYANG